MQLNESPHCDTLQLPASPTYFADCCVPISKELIDVLHSELGNAQGSILSIGCGSGLLERFLLDHADKELDIVGIEIPTCQIQHLPESRVIRVRDTHQLHEDAILASTLMFIYPRASSLIWRYLQLCRKSALEKVVLWTTCTDWQELRPIFTEHDINMRALQAGIVPKYDILLVGTC